MAYRGDEAKGALEAPTASGPLRLELGPRQITLTAGPRMLHIADQFITLVDAKKKQESVRREGRLVLARDVPREGLGIWLEVVRGQRGMRRIFGVDPAPLLEPGGLVALQRLDALAHQLRVALAEHGGEPRRGPEVGTDGDPARVCARGIELGRGLDKVLLADHGDHHAVYARRLFRDHARFTLAVYDDGKIVFAEHDAITVRSRFGVTVLGDYLRFADDEGVDLGRVSIPWIAPEDREELARRIGQLVDRG